MVVCSCYSALEQTGPDTQGGGLPRREGVDLKRALEFGGNTYLGFVVRIAEIQGWCSIFIKISRPSEEEEELGMDMDSERGDRNQASVKESTGVSRVGGA